MKFFEIRTNIFEFKLKLAENNHNDILKFEIFSRECFSTDGVIC